MSGKMSKSTKKKIWIGIGIGAVVGVMSLCAFFVIFMMFFLDTGTAND